MRSSSPHGQRMSTRDVKWSRLSFRLGIFSPTARHFDPVQFLFHLMKRVVADLFTHPHGENSLARRLKGSAVTVAVGEPSGFAFFRIDINRSQVRDEFLSDRLCDRRSVVFETRKPGTQGAFTRRGDFVSDRIIVTQVERSEEHTSELQSLAYLVCRLLLEKKKKD